MAKKFLTPLVPPRLSADPNSSVEGAIYYNTVAKAFKYFDGTTWSLIGGGGGGSNNLLEVLDEAPSSPVEGQIYFDTLESTVKVYNGYVWYDAGGPREIIDHTHYAGEGRVRDAWYGEYVVDELVFIDGGTSTTVYSDDIIDGGTSNG